MQALRHPVSQNVVALYGVQFATFIAPLVTLPYLSRVLGPQAFGLVVFSLGLSFILGLIIDFGFPASATREAAALRNDQPALARLVSRVLGAKLVLILAATAVAAVALLAIPKLHEQPLLLLFAWIAAVANSLAPIWFFTGLEKLRLISVVQLVSRFGSGAFVILLVKHPNDAWIVLALYAAASVASSALTSGLMYRRIPMLRPRFADLRQTVGEAWALFISTAALTMYTALNVVLLGLFVPAAQVAHFGAAERLVRSALQLIGPVTNAAYPRLAFLQESNERQRARLLALIAVGVLGFVGLCTAAFLAFAAPVIISIVFGPGYGEAVILLRVMVLIIPAFIVSSVASGWLMSLHRDRTVLRVVLSAGLVNVILAIVLVPLMGPAGMAVSVAAAEFTAAIGYAVEILRTEGYSISALAARGLRRLREIQVGAVGGGSTVSAPTASRALLR